MTEQLNLFDRKQTRTDAVSTIPGLVYRTGFVSSEEHDELLELIDAAPWRTDLKRRVQHYGYRYDYKARRIDTDMYLGELPVWATSLARRLVDDGLMPETPDQVIVNEYQPGQGISPHVDCEPCFGNAIATVSLGHMYEMDFTKLGSSERVALLLQVGSVLVMKGEARYKWKHGIRPRKSDRGVPRRRRVSLTFRSVIVGG